MLAVVMWRVGSTPLAMTSDLTPLNRRIALFALRVRARVLLDIP